MMIDSALASAVIDHGLSRGADFVDLFVEETNRCSSNFTDRKITEVTSGTDFGIGVRVVFGLRALYGYTNISTKEELLRVTNLLCALETGSSNGNPVALKRMHPPRHSLVTRGLDKDVLFAEKLRFMQQLDQAVRLHKGISQVDIGVGQKLQKVAIYNSEGLEVHDERHYTRLRAMAIAVDGNEQAKAYEGPGAMQGWEFIEQLDAEKLGDTLARRATTILKAKACPAGKMPVVIDSGFGGVIFHEACGHLLETTSVEKKASVFHDKMGEVIAHPAVTAVDDGLIANAWGSLHSDDEGMPVQRTVLIKEGKLVSFLVDRLGELKTGFKRTGSGRRQSYKFPPASRMRNTFIEAGPHSREEIIATVGHGLYAKAMGGGSVIPGTGEFNFAVEEAYMIKDGKIAEAVKGATLIGAGPDILQKISMVGNNFALQAGMCGSVSGSIPVTVGQPAIKVDEILVGGQA